ncbi:MAG: response regulator [Desulfobulbaceae bacterium]|nr:response regulator [Desulfobulbaceae bacterium]
MKKKVLVIEDEPANMKLVLDLLEVAGHCTLAANNGRQGVELAQKELPDLILMDIQMPVMDGLEATRLLKADEQTKHIPIIALTALAMQGDDKIIKNAGCDGYITKPIDIKKFLKEINLRLTSNRPE